MATKELNNKSTSPAHHRLNANIMVLTILRMIYALYPEKSRCFEYYAQCPSVSMLTFAIISNGPAVANGFHRCYCKTEQKKNRIPIQNVFKKTNKKNPRKAQM